jgi:hypothetical protein
VLTITNPTTDSCEGADRHDRFPTVCGTVVNPGAIANAIRAMTAQCGQQRRHPVLERHVQR